MVVELVEVEVVEVVVVVVVLFANRCERLAATFGWSFKNFKKLARRDVMTGCSSVVPLSSHIRGGGFLSGVCGWSGQLRLPPLDGRGDCDVMTGCSSVVPLSSHIRGGGFLSGVCGWSGQLRLPPLDGRGDCALERYLTGISLLLFCHAASELMVGLIVVGRQGAL